MITRITYTGLGILGGILLSFFIVPKTPEVKHHIVTEYQTEEVIKEVIKEVVKWKTKVEYRDRVVTRYIEKPDGTKITEKIEEKSNSESKSAEYAYNESKDNRSSVTARQDLIKEQNYSLSIIGSIVMNNQGIRSYTTGIEYKYNRYILGSDIFFNKDKELEAFSVRFGINL